MTADSIVESRKLEDMIRDWGDSYGEKFTDTEPSGENRCLERRIAACYSSLGVIRERLSQTL